ncbi:PD-(D/E)XK nuclease family protein [Aurantiacibacter flavus]|uniref:PD-(D/E)XK nuclease family protein n=1 Tax=Aurantiacibacter flavus TaxID=3145232 RepID=A0ABV0CUI4_9SPHN
MSERAGPSVYSIAAHRGFADALVAGLVPRYGDDTFGLARLTLLVPSTRAARTITEAFVRHAGEAGTSGLLLPRMVQVGDLDLDEALGPLFDSLGAGAAVPPAADPVRRTLKLAQLIGEVEGKDAPTGAALMRLATETGRVIDRLLIEDIEPHDLLSERVLGILAANSDHWRDNLALFAKVQLLWRDHLEQRGEIDMSARRNLLFRAAARRLREAPPENPIVAAGVTSAAPALAEMLRTIAHMPQGAVILPDFDLSMDEEVWDELGHAGDPSLEEPFGRDDAITHPQYHLKLLLGRMGIAREEVRPWHRAGLGKGPPARSHAISSLFLPPLASRRWAALPAKQRRLAGVQLIEAGNPEEEAQAIALLVREALDVPERRVAVVTPDRGLAARVSQHLRRWNVRADDSAGVPLSQTAAGRVLLLLAQVGAERAAPVPLMALLGHPLVGHEERADWLRAVRRLELRLRGPRRASGLEEPRRLAEKAGVADWWQTVEPILVPLLEVTAPLGLAEWLDLLAAAGEALCSESLWAREDGRALSAFIEQWRLHAREVPVDFASDELPRVLRDLLDQVAVRPQFGGHPRVAIYGLLEARMTRADLVICGGLNEGTWPPAPTSDPLLAPAVLRALGVPGADFRIGLAAHDLAGALGAPEVVLTRARRDVSGPAIPSRFLLRVRALLGGDLAAAASDEQTLRLARELDPAPMEIAPYPVPAPMPSADQRRQDISVTQLDRLRSDPFEFYASKIMGLRDLDPLDAEPDAAWQGTLAHAILEHWHKGEGQIEALAEQHLADMHTHPLMRALWKPRLVRALQWIVAQIGEDPQRQPLPNGIEAKGEMHVEGIRIHGKADRIDRMADGTLAIVDYKTGGPPTGPTVENGYALQLGTLGLIARDGGFTGIVGDPAAFEYWSLGKAKVKDHPTGFGYVTTPLKVGSKRSGILPEDFLPEAERYLHDALGRWILGEEPFTAGLNPDAPGYNTYDHLMRLGEWQGRGDER